MNAEYIPIHNPILLGLVKLYLKAPMKGELNHIEKIICAPTVVGFKLCIAMKHKIIPKIELIIEKFFILRNITSQAKARFSASSPQGDFGLPC